MNNAPTKKADGIPNKTVVRPFPLFRPGDLTQSGARENARSQGKRREWCQSETFEANLVNFV